MTKPIQKLQTFAVGVLLAQTPPPGTPPPAGVLNPFFTGQIKSLFGTASGPAGKESIGGLITSVLEILLVVAGSIAALFLVIGGVQYILSRGNEEAAEGAKKTMTAAVVGLIAIIMSFAIVYIISSLLITGNTGIE